jgi:hypothetical protein
MKDRTLEVGQFCHWNWEWAADAIGDERCVLWRNVWLYPDAVSRHLAADVGLQSAIDPTATQLNG